MKALVKEVTRALTHSTSCAGMARWLHEIVSIIMDSDVSERSGILQEVLNAVESAALMKLENYLTLPDYDPWYVACGVEANFLYITFEVIRSYKDENPMVKLAKLDYIASALERSNDSAIRNVQHVHEIMEYCESTFGVIKRSQYNLALMILPDIDIGCVADCPMLHEDIIAMCVNEKHAPKSLVEVFAYEIAGLLLATEPLPEEATALLEQTTTPEIRSICEEDQYWAFVMAIKLGLAYNGPYSCMLGSENEMERFGKRWHDYLVQKLNED